jgi:hypothetical protein
LIDKTVQMLFEFARDFRWATRSRTIQQALGALSGKALHPFAKGGIGKVEQHGDGIDVVACDHLPDGLRAAKDAGFLGLLEHGI